MSQPVTLAELKTLLLDNPQKETLIEIISNAQFPNPVIKSMVFMALQAMKPEDVTRFSKVAVAAIQYAQAGDKDGLENLCKRTGIPAPIVSIITGYVSNQPQQ